MQPKDRFELGPPDVQPSVSWFIEKGVSAWWRGFCHRNIPPLWVRFLPEVISSPFEKLVGFSRVCGLIGLFLRSCGFFVNVLSKEGALNEDVEDLLGSILYMMSYVAGLYSVRALLSAWRLLAGIPGELSPGLCTIMMLPLIICALPTTREACLNSLRPAARALSSGLSFCFGQILRLSYLVWRRYIKAELEELDRVAYESVGGGQQALPAELAYRYRPIGERASFRLLKLEKSHPRAEVKYTLVECDLNAVPPYEAISYTWGIPSDKTFLTVEGQRLLIPTNAYLIIQQRTSWWKTRLIWIDCVCIDQGSKNEKTGQLRLIPDIFRRARQVSICLGKASNADSAISYVYYNFFELATSETFAGDEHSVDHPGVAAFYELLSHPYWARTWIIEEIAVAKKAVLYYGDLSISFNLLQMIAWKVGARAPDFSDFRSEVMYRSRWRSAADLKLMGYLQGWSRLTNISLVRRRTIQGDPLPILDLLAMSRESKAEATEPRDRVFALVGISQAAHEPELQPVASKPTHDVYRELAAHHLSRGEPPLDILHFAGTGYQRVTADLPSWVPDWNATKTQSVLGPDPEGYCASFGMTPSVRISNDFFLEVKGRLLDRVEEVVPPPQEFEYLAAEVYTIEATFRKAWDVASRRWPISYLNGDTSTSEAFWRTLLGDRILIPTYIRPAPHVYGEHYEAARRLLQLGVNLATGRLQVDDESDIGDILWQADEDDGLGAKQFLKAYGSFSKSCGFALTRDGYMAIVPPATEPDDLVCIIDGAKTPFLMRPTGVWGEVYELVGDCYVHGWMDGEMSNAGRRQLFQLG